MRYANDTRVKLIGSLYIGCGRWVVIAASARADQPWTHRVRHLLLREPEMKQLKGFILSSAWTLWIVLIIAQAILSLFLYNPAGNQALRIVGWIVGAVAALFGMLPMITLRRQGGIPREKDYTHTTILVDSGIYSVVRHPQYLSFMLLNLFLILIAQHWLITMIGIAAMALVYTGIVPQADQANIEKFGDEYKRYMQSVPGMNTFTGVIWLLRRRRKDDKSRGG